MGSSRPVASLLAALLTLAPALGAAQPKGPTDKEKSAARDLVKKAIAASKEGDHKDAIELYLNAYAIVPQPLLLSNIGSEYQLSAKPLDALTYFCKYLEADPDGSNVAYATAQAKVLQTQLGREINDKDVCHPIEKPVPPLPPEPHPTGGATTAGAGAGGGSGSASGTATSSAKVADITPGGGSPAVTGTADLEHGEPPAPSPGHGMRVAGLGIGVVGIAAFGAGIVYAIKGKNMSDYVNNYTTTHPGQPWPDDIAQRDSDGHTDNTLQAVFMIAGGVAIIGGGALYMMGRKKASAEHVSVIPIATPRAVGVALSGAY